MELPNLSNTDYWLRPEDWCHQNLTDQGFKIENLKLRSQGILFIAILKEGDIYQINSDGSVKRMEHCKEFEALLTQLWEAERSS